MFAVFLGVSCFYGSALQAMSADLPIEPLGISFRMPSFERIEQRRLVCRTEFAKNARICSALWVGGGVVTAAAVSYAAWRFFATSSQDQKIKTNQSLACDSSATRDIDLLYKQIYIDQALREEQERTLQGMVSSQVKKGVGYAVGTFTTAYLLMLLSTIQDRALSTQWRNCIYRTKEDGFRDKAHMLMLQMKLMEEAMLQFVKEFSVVNQGDKFEEFKHFKSYFLASFADAHSGLIRALEDLIAYVIESIALLNEEKRDLDGAVEKQLAVLLHGLEIGNKGFDALLTSDSHEELTRSSIVCLGQVKKIVMRISGLVLFLGDHLYELPIAERYE